MAKIVTSPNTGNKQQQDQGLALGALEFGIESAKAALSTVQALQNQQQTPEPKKNNFDVAQNQPQTKQPATKTTAKQAHHKTDVEIREENSLRLKMAAGGSATGVRNNKQPVIRNGRDVNADGMVDAYEEMGYQTADAKDDVATALQKKIANLEAALPTPSVLTEDLGAAWEGLGGNNSVGSAFRDKGSLDVLMGSRGLLSVMTGMSEALDQYLQRTVPENRFDPVTGQPDMFFLFEMMRKKHKETLTEFEREAELMLGGSVAILAIPQIIEKLIEMGVNPMLARSLEGPLNKLIKECKKKDDELHSLYMMIKEEAELSVRPEEEEQQAV